MDTCLFCRIVKKDIPARFVYEDETAVVIGDINPQAPFHFLVIPREHYEGIHMVPSDNVQFFDKMMITTVSFIKKEGLESKGYRLVINYGEKGGQTVPHIHIHILSGRQMKWPPG